MARAQSKLFHALRRGVGQFGFGFRIVFVEPAENFQAFCGVHGAGISLQAVVVVSKVQALQDKPSPLCPAATVADQSPVCASTWRCACSSVCCAALSSSAVVCGWRSNLLTSARAYAKAVFSWRS